MVTKFKIGVFLPDPSEWYGGVNYYLRLLQLFEGENKKLDLEFIVFNSSLLPHAVLNKIEKIEHVTLVNVVNLKQTKLNLLKSIFLGKDPIVSKLIDEYSLDFIIESGAFYGWRLYHKAISWIPDLQHAVLKGNFSFLSRLKRDIGFFIQGLTRRKVYCSSYDARELYSKRYFKKLDSISVVRFSVSNSELGFVSREKINKTIGKYNVRELFLYFPGQLWIHKNHKLVIEALAYLKKKGCKLSYQIVCSGSLSDFRNEHHYEQLLNLMTELDINCEDICFLGQIDFDDVHSLMCGSVGVINPSMFEGWSTVVEEARCLGKKMILSDINIHVEQGPKNTTYFTANDAISLANELLSFNSDIKQSKNESEFDFMSVDCETHNRFMNDFINLIVK